MPQCALPSNVPALAALALLAAFGSARDGDDFYLVSSSFASAPDLRGAGMAARGYADIDWFRIEHLEKERIQ